MPGRLLVCATPIGNLGDVTARVLEALRAADAIVAEDTRVTRRLLARYGIEASPERYDEHVAEQRTPDLLARMQAGATLALVSDAGTPGISDPGTRLVSAALDAGIVVDVLPGPSAILTALVASGLPTHAFYFGGFLPRKAGERASALARLAELDATLVFYESPHRATSTLAAVADVFPARRVALARELTKIHQEVIRGTAMQVAAELAQRGDLKGEVVVLVGPPAPEETEVEFDARTVRERVEELKARGYTTKDAIRCASDEAGIPRNRVYELAHARERTS